MSNPAPVGVCAIISFRLGLSDGVSIVASSWQRALAELGWETYTVAGDGPVDHLVPGLALDNPQTAGPMTLRDQVDAALAAADVVLVENLLTIPMNLDASRAVADVLAGRPAVLHHHDPPWQRERFAHITELPPDDPKWRHVTINRMTEREFADRGLPATTIYNGFDQDQPLGDRSKTRDLLGLDEGDDQYLFAHPVRAIARKNIPSDIQLCEHLGATYWLPKPAEEGYGPELDRILGAARCPILRTGVADLDLTMADLYAAADLVLFPSTWEGFGNPPVEAAIHRRPAVVGDYPVAEELRALGFQWLRAEERHRISEVLRRLAAGSAAEEDVLDRNQRIARDHLSIARMTQAMRNVFEDLSWTS